MSFTIEQRAKIVKSYLKTKLLLQTQREYRKHFGVKQAPSSTAIKKIAQKFEVHGTCHNRNQEISGKSVSAHTEINVDLICESTVRIAKPKKIITKMFLWTWLDKFYYSRIMKHNINFYPYKLQ